MESTFGDNLFAPVRSRMGAWTLLRWMFLTPAYFVGLGILVMPFFFVFFYDSEWGFAHDYWFFGIGSFLASLGASGLPAIVAPRHKLVVALSCSLLTAVGGYLVVASRDEYPQWLFLGYLFGGFIASAFVYGWCNSRKKSIGGVSY
jgi:hypothetical protein